jgi:hypothetical protein
MPGLPVNRPAWRLSESFRHKYQSDDIRPLLSVHNSQSHRRRRIVGVRKSWGFCDVEPVTRSGRVATGSTLPPPPASFQSRQRNSPTYWGSFLDGDPPPRTRLGDPIAGRIILWLIELLIHDFPDGASTASATNSATETSVDSARGTARHHPRDSSHLLVAQYIAGANNHREMAPTADLRYKYSRVAPVPFTSSRPKGTTGAQQNCLPRQSLAGGSTSIDDELTSSARARMRIEDGSRIRNAIAQATRRARPAFFETRIIAAQSIVGPAGQTERSRHCGRR